MYRQKQNRCCLGQAGGPIGAAEAALVDKLFLLSTGVVSDVRRISR